MRRQIELLSVVVERLSTTTSLQYFNSCLPANNMMVESKVAVVMSSAAWWCQVATQGHYPLKCLEHV